MTTANTIIERAYSLIGAKSAGDALSAEDSSYGLDALNSLIDGWNTDSLYILTVQNVMASVSGASATVGTGLTFNTSKPVALDVGGYTRIGTVDYPITPIERQEYAAISDKSVATSFPDCAYYDPAGVVYFYPAISVPVSVSLPFMVQLSAFADLGTDYVLAPGYRRALEYSLAEELAPGFKPLDPKIMRSAANARKAIRNRNVRVPLMDTGMNTRRFDIYRGY